jgi:formylglycine-generating enzyme required for sulfatase activity
MRPLIVAALAVGACAGRSHPGMVHVPAGPFQRGATGAEVDAEAALCPEPDRCRARLAHEQPARTVELRGFYLDRDEVTNAAYARCVAAGACAPPAWATCSTAKFEELAGGVPADHVLRRPDHPAVCITHAQAAAFCRWRGARLPGEAEWEKAAEGPRDRRFPWGDAWDPGALNWREGDHDWTAPVGSYPRGASPYGARDLAGNVWEFTADWYDPAAYASAPARDPPGGPGRDMLVTRGGGFAANPIAHTTDHRAPQRPEVFGVNFGFRCAADE